jgi:hypothetical protein
VLNGDERNSAAMWPVSPEMASPLEILTPVMYRLFDEIFCIAVTVEKKVKFIYLTKMLTFGAKFGGLNPYIRYRKRSLWFAGRNDCEIGRAVQFGASCLETNKI